MNWDWQKIIYFLIGLLLGAVLHEYMHARIADWRGDKTARNAGRMTLNPIAHIDPLGTVLMPIVLLLASQGNMAFAYAKPVPVNPFFLKKPRRDMMLVAVAGPTTNFVFAAVLTLLAVILRLIFGLQFSYPVNQTITCYNGSVWANLFLLLASVAVINIMLGVFNLIPIPPLDGSHIVEFFLPARARQIYESIAPISFIILILFIWLLQGPLYRLMRPIIKLVAAGVFGSSAYAQGVLF